MCISSSLSVELPGVNAKIARFATFASSGNRYPSLTTTILKVEKSRSIDSNISGRHIDARFLVITTVISPQSRVADSPAYKKEYKFTDEMATELLNCAKISADLDERMGNLKQMIEK